MKNNVLISYAYWNDAFIDVLQKEKKYVSLILDSGAFTARKGKGIDFDEYCAFVKSPPVDIDRYFALDVIGDWVATKKNLNKMIQRGLNPVPVFTRGTPIEELDEMYSVSDLVGIGGLVWTNAKSYVKWIMSHVGKRRVHWLGFFDLDFVKHYKPYSIDSSWASCPIRFGRLYFLDDSGNLQSFKCRSKIPKEIQRICSKYSLDYSLLKTGIGWDGCKNRLPFSFYVQLLVLFDVMKKLEKHCSVNFYNVVTAYPVMNVTQECYHLWSGEEVELTFNRGE